MRKSIVAGAWQSGTVALLLVALCTGVAQGGTTYHCDVVTERKSVDFDGVELDRECIEYPNLPAAKVAEQGQMCRDRSPGKGRWTEGACGKDERIASCAVTSIGPAPLEVPFTHRFYRPRGGGNMTVKEAVEMARQQCKIMSIGSGKFTEP